MTEKIVALDIGSSSLRAIEATVKNGLPQILRIAELPLDSHIVENGVVVSPESLSLAIGKLWKTGKFESKKVVALASGSTLINRVLDNLPYAKDEDFKKLLPFTVTDRIPYELDEFYLDSHTLDEYRDENTLEIKKIALVTGVSKAYVDTVVGALERNGLKPQGIDALPLALIRSQSVSPTFDPRNVVASIELGSDVTTIVIHQNHQPIYLHTAPGLGGQHITERLAFELRLTFPKAEFLKIGLGANPEERNSMVQTVPKEGGQFEKISFNDFTTEQINEGKKIIAQEVSNLISHVNDIIDDSAASAEYYVSEISLNGGGAVLSTLHQRLESELNIKTTISQPFGEERSKKIDPNIFASQHRYSAVFGLLLGQDVKVK